MKDEWKPMSKAEAGRKGGLRTKQRQGDTFFQEIGRKGGQKGGNTTKARYGVEHYRRIGAIGGSRGKRGGRRKGAAQ